MRFHGTLAPSFALGWQTVYERSNGANVNKQAEKAESKSTKIEDIGNAGSTLTAASFDSGDGGVGSSEAGDSGSGSGFGFEIGDTVISDFGESEKAFLMRVAPRFIELSEKYGAEIASQIFIQANGEQGYLALFIETSYLPQLSGSSAGNAPNGFTGTGKTVHTHAGKVKFTKAIQKATKAYINKHALDKKHKKQLMEAYYHPFKIGKYVPAGSNSFSDQDYRNPGYLIGRDNNLRYQEGKETASIVGQF